jgi:NAD(P)-dependent dehydrogenase (short-subunit alcohol dehydrogenase family)
LITGLGPDGISEAAVEALISAKVGTIFGTARTVSKAQAVFDRFKGTKTDLISIQMDNSDLASVRSAVKAIQSNKKTIDVIICSAGIMASPFQKTDDGIESQFQVCHLAHFLLVQGLRDTLSSDARVVSVTSMGHHAGPVRLDDYNFDDGKQYDPWLGYGQVSSDPHNLTDDADIHYSSIRQRRLISSLQSRFAKEIFQLIPFIQVSLEQES